MAELGRTDIEARWLAHSLRFWNSLCAQPRGSLHHELLMIARSEALLVGTRTWVWRLRRECQRLGYELPLSTQRAQRVNMNMCWACGQRSSSGHGRRSACAGRASDVPDRGCS